MYEIIDHSKNDMLIKHLSHHVKIVHRCLLLTIREIMRGILDLTITAIVD